MEVLNHAVEAGNLQVRKKNNMAMLTKQIVKNKWLYILILPGLIYFFIFHYLPIYGVIIAFKDFDIVKGIWESPWIGFGNFGRLFSSGQFYNVFKNSILLSFYRTLWGFPAPILLALMMNEIRHGMYKKVTQTIIYLPHFISWVVLVGIVNNFLSPSNGIINLLLNHMGFESVAFMQKPQFFRTIVVSSEIWKEVGWNSIIYLAAITGIDPSLYESSIIDGASRFQQIRYITIPSILSTIIVVLIMHLGYILRNGFEQVLLMYNPLVYNVADVFETFSYRTGLQEGMYGYATAVGLFQSVVGLIMIWLANKFAKKAGESSLW